MRKKANIQVTMDRPPLLLVRLLLLLLLLLLMCLVEELVFPFSTAVTLLDRRIIGAIMCEVFLFVDNTTDSSGALCV